MATRRIVLDSFALIAYFRKEPGSDTVKQILRSVSSSLLLHRINWGEVYYRAYRVSGEVGAERVVRAIRRFPIEVVDEFGEEFVRKVARLKGKYPISYADGFAIQTALDYQAELVTGDPEIKKVTGREKKLNLIWLGE